MKTAIEWLIEKHFGSIENCTPDFRNKIKQAIEMKKYKGWIIQKNDYNYENNSYLSYEYYNGNDCDCPIRHCSTVDDCKENIDYLINEFYY